MDEHVDAAREGDGFVAIEKPTAMGQFELGNGEVTSLRAVRPDDADRLIALFGRLSPESVYYRFLEPRRHLPRSQAELFARVDYATTMAIVATLPHGEDEDIIGVARYALIEPFDDGIAEAAIVVQDDRQSQGLGTELLTRLVEYASGHGVRAFQATIHQSNNRILRFIERSGLPTTKRLEGGVWDVRVSLEPPTET